MSGTEAEEFLSTDKQQPDVLQQIVDAVHQRHGYDVLALDMTEYPLTMDIFLLTSADNRIQSRAIADHVERTARKLGWKLHHKEGYSEGSWILLDFIDLVVHIFLPDVRKYYNIESLWSDAPVMKFEDKQTIEDNEDFTFEIAPSD
ncbi:MAG: ribosome silencing factor [Gemmatimonadaceae bacterium 4484_173]|jgi:ribosome-associated protein|nr:MAG: ribosome silencing factor [Gemmatimonadaceae bacterium 4484_173]RKZ01025.1 MAG: ribosome silencing factor [Candidatus Fermentibacteria bacterium]